MEMKKYHCNGALQWKEQIYNKAPTALTEKRPLSKPHKFTENTKTNI